MIDAKTIELMNELIKEVSEKKPESKPVVLTDEQIDEMVGPPLTLEEHRNFYRMYVAILKAAKEQTELASSSALNEYRRARHELRQPSGLLALIELVERSCYQKILSPLAENVHIRAGLQKTYRGKKPKENPFKDAFIAFVSANPGMTLIQVERAHKEWLDDEIGHYDGIEKMFYRQNHKGDDVLVTEAMLRSWFTQGRKRAKNSADT